MLHTFSRNSHTTWLPILAAIVSFLIFALRRPDIIYNASFWAEDGLVWYKQAYEFGIASLALPQNGYYQTISKLTALASLVVPMEYAPLFFNVAGLTIRSLFVAYILTNRMSAIPLSYRIAVCVYIVLMPGLIEVHANITNTQWYLSMWILCVLLSNRPNSQLWFLHDIFLMFLSGLSGPFVVFLVPVFAVRYGFDRDFRNYIKTTKGMIFAGSLITACAIQVIAVLLSYNETRSSAPLGFSFSVMADILSARIFVGAFLTADQIRWLFSHAAINAVVTIFSLALLTFVFLKSNWIVKSIILFASIMLFFALSKPMISLTEPQLPLLASGVERYFVITNIAWVISLLSAYYYISKNLKNTVKYTILTTTVAVFFFVTAFNFSIEPLLDTKWPEQAKAFQNLNSGERFEFQLNPPSWKMTLVR
ncbi:hypothetical protein [Brucella rhizosphaerae]|uniref:hypothetical protein n=1 Tax=Brucella rhizosphaerae TaxID=571254 RepID=UPI0004636758|nr:hypothetical protein [Brucella rhizosphaerae]